MIFYLWIMILDLYFKCTSRTKHLGPWGNFRNLSTWARPRKKRKKKKKKTLWELQSKTKPHSYAVQTLSKNLYQKTMLLQPSLKMIQNTFISSTYSKLSVTFIKIWTSWVSILCFNDALKPSRINLHHAQSLLT